MTKTGDKVKIEKKDGEVLAGIVMPTEGNDVVLKLDNGYNIGIEKKNIKKSEVIEEYKEAKERQEKDTKKKNGLPNITVLHTGGTIASKVDYKTGGVTAHFSAEDLISMFPEISDVANIKTELVANMMSEDMAFKDYQKIAAAAKKHAEKGVDGIIIGHGTDTLAVTAAALSFMFEKINIPVLLVGSQRSSDRGSTDAASNLICAAEFIAKTDFRGVAICMHSSSSDDKCAILPATKTRKMHTSRRDAFKAVNGELIALVDYKTREVEMLDEGYLNKKDSKIQVKDKFEDDVGILRTHPNIKPELFEFYAKNYKGFVLEATGLGQAPTNTGEDNLKNYEILKSYIQKGGIVVLTSQCIFGRVHEDIYRNCRRLKQIGVIFADDMLTETAFVKLAWLLGNYDVSEAKDMMWKNIRGEITDRSLYKEEFLE